MGQSLVQEADRATDWVREFERFAPELRRREPAWLAELRRRAMQSFAKRGFPTPREEDWRSTNLGPIAKGRFVPSLGVAAERVPAEVLTLHRPEDPRSLALVFVDGRYAPELSAAGAGNDAVRAGSLATFLAREPELLEPFFGRMVDIEQPLAALGTALFEDGAFVLVPRGVVLEQPIHVLHLVTPRAEKLAILPRSLVVLEESAQATLVERFAGPGSGASFTAALTEVHAGPGALLERYELQDQDPQAFHLALTRARLERGAKLRSHQVTFGAALSRSELEVELAGEGAECTLDGLYVLDGERRTECRTFVDHALPHGRSRQDYRGILDGRARGAFAGRVLVREGAQKSDARQLHRSLLLALDATADSKPELRIHADDVKCAHGATVGRLDESQVFFLRARGIGEGDARRILTRAFASAILDGIRLPELRRGLERALDERLAGESR